MPHIDHNTYLNTRNKKLCDATALIMCRWPFFFKSS